MKPVVIVALCTLIVGVSGCSNQSAGPSRTSYRPSNAGSQAIQQYDADGSRELDSDELDACPALRVALDRVDRNGSGTISADEISKRLEYFETAPTIILSGSLIVALDGRPLEGATVTFEPEPFMGSSINPCSDVTSGSGKAFVTDPAAAFDGIPLGFYRVRISKMQDGKELIPAKYNTESVLGYEASDDIPDVSDVIRFSLSSK